MTPEEIQISNTIGTVLLDLLPVIIGGFLAVIGGFMAPIFSQRLNKKTFITKLKREKLEQLVSASYTMRHWLIEKEDINLWGKDKNIGESPIYGIQMIENLYIPELKKEVYKLSLAVITYEKWIIDRRKAKLSSQELTQEHIKDYNLIYEKLLNAIFDLTNKASDIMDEINKS